MFFVLFFSNDSRLVYPVVCVIIIFLPNLAVFLNFAIRNFKNEIPEHSDPLFHNEFLFNVININFVLFGGFDSNNYDGMAHIPRTVAFDSPLNA